MYWLTTSVVGFLAGSLAFISRMVWRSKFKVMDSTTRNNTTHGERRLLVEVWDAGWSRRPRFEKLAARRVLDALCSRWCERTGCTGCNTTVSWLHWTQLMQKASALGHFCISALLHSWRVDVLTLQVVPSHAKVLLGFNTGSPTPPISITHLHVLSHSSSDKALLPVHSILTKKVN